MAPRRSSRVNRDTSEEPANLQSSSIFTGAAVQTNLPPIPSRFSTAYGSDVTPSRVLNTRRGEHRSIQNVIDDILDADDGSDLAAEEERDEPEDRPKPPPKRPSRQPPSKSTLADKAPVPPQATAPAPAQAPSLAAKSTAKRPQSEFLGTPARGPTRQPLMVNTPTPRRLSGRSAAIAPSGKPQRGATPEPEDGSSRVDKDFRYEHDPIPPRVPQERPQQTTNRQSFRPSHESENDPRRFYGGINTPGSSIVTYGEEVSLYGAGGVSHGGSSQASTTPVRNPQARPKLPDGWFSPSLVPKQFSDSSTINPMHPGYGNKNSSNDAPGYENPFALVPSISPQSAVTNKAQPKGHGPAPENNPPSTKPKAAVDRASEMANPFAFLPSRPGAHTANKTQTGALDPPQIIEPLEPNAPPSPKTAPMERRLRSKATVADLAKSAPSPSGRPSDSVNKVDANKEHPEKLHGQRSNQPATSASAKPVEKTTFTTNPAGRPKSIATIKSANPFRGPTMHKFPPKKPLQQHQSTSSQTMPKPAPYQLPPTPRDYDAHDVSESDVLDDSFIDENPQTWATWLDSLHRWFKPRRIAGGRGDPDIDLSEMSDKHEEAGLREDAEPGSMTASQWLWHCLMEFLLDCYSRLHRVYLSLQNLASQARYLALDTPFRWILLALSSVAVAVLLHSFYSPSPPMDLIWESDNEVTPWSFHWHGWGLSDMTWNLGQFIPLSLARPSTLFASEQARAYEERLRSFSHEMHHLKASKDFHDESLAKLESLLPKIIHLEVGQNGKPRIAPEFYYALRELMKKDNEVFTFEADEAGYVHVPDEHWQAIKNKADGESFLVRNNKTREPALSRAEVQEMIRSDIPDTWTEWAKSNKQKVADVVKHHLPLPEAPLSGSDDMPANLDERIEQVALQHIARQIADENSSLITRRNFMFIIKEEFAKDHGHISHEALVLKDQAKAYVQGLLKTSLEENPALLGLSRDEVLHLVNGQIRKVIADAGIKAFADGKIAAEWDQDLQNRVNFFNPHLGAIISPDTTPTYKPKELGPEMFLTGKWSNHPSRRHPAPLNPGQALLGWTDAGDCWCGSTTYSREGTPQGIALNVILGHRIKPEYLVIDHIMPGATLAPGARPRQIELWVKIDEWNHRELVRDFAAYTWPSSLKQPFGQSFVQVSSFEYESQASSGGVYVHKLPDELKGLRLSTEHIIVRPVTNYGDEEKTCLYRVRLFGESDDPLLVDGAT